MRDGEDYWPHEGFLMTDMQICSLHMALGKLVSNSFVALRIRQEALNIIIDDLHQACCDQHGRPPRPRNGNNSSDWYTDERYKEASL